MSNVTASIAPFANMIGWSDIDPYEVVRVISDRTVEVREMKSELAADWTPNVVAGGFAGHCVNNGDQRWIITPNESAPITRIRLGKKGWKDARGNRYRMDAEPIRFYDYNF